MRTFLLLLAPSTPLPAAAGSEVVKVVAPDGLSYDVYCGVGWTPGTDQGGGG